MPCAFSCFVIKIGRRNMKKRVLMLASVASMIDQFNMSNIRLMIEAGCQVHVACNFAEGNTCDSRRIQQLKDTLQKLGVVQHQWDCPRGFQSLRRCMRAYIQLWKLTGRYHFAWIHCHSPVGGVLARAAAHQRKTAVIYTAHGFHFFKGAPLKNWLLYYPVEKLLSYWTDVLVTVNREDYQFAKRNMGAGRIYFIPGIGIDIKKFQKQTEETVHTACGQAEETAYSACGQAEETVHTAYGQAGEAVRIKYRIPKHAVLLLSVGELSRRKNHQAVIEALAELSRTDLYYLICGQGGLKEELAQQAHRLGIADRVILPGFQQDVADMYRSADLFVFPSLQEGMPVALMEAMAAGLPCVVSDIRGNRDLIDEQGGKKFVVSKTGQLKEGIMYFLEHPKERALYGQHNQEVVTGYSIEVVQKRMRIIYAGMGKYY